MVKDRKVNGLEYSVVPMLFGTRYSGKKKSCDFEEVQCCLALKVDYEGSLISLRPHP